MLKSSGSPARTWPVILGETIFCRPDRLLNTHDSITA